eukprot:1158214-Pelagomonas_calceolata.AAC.1
MEAGKKRVLPPAQPVYTPPQLDRPCKLSSAAAYKPYQIGKGNTFHINKEKRMPRAKALRILSTKRMEDASDLRRFYCPTADLLLDIRECLSAYSCLPTAAMHLRQPVAEAATFSLHPAPDLLSLLIPTSRTWQVHLKPSNPDPHIMEHMCRAIQTWQTCSSLGGGPAAAGQRLLEELRSGFVFLVVLNPILFKEISPPSPPPEVSIGPPPA